MIHVIATIETRDGCREQLLTAFAANVPNVLAEEGCLEYGCAVDLPTGIDAQTPPRDSVVVVIEKWKSLPALRAHLAAEHMQAFREGVNEIVKSVRLQILGPAGE